MIQKEIPGDARIQEAEFELRAASSLAYDDLIHAWMSELPVEREILAFAFRVILAYKNTGANSFYAVEAKRTDRGEAVVRASLEAADKARHEIHRMMGFLRFRESNSARMVAFCEPDHAILPALGAHFYARFGQEAWAICDLRRLTALVCDPPALPALIRFEADDSEFGLAAAMSDEWEQLWQAYHRSVSIENRTNRRLQRQLMPLRYWKYLTELYDGAIEGGHDEGRIIHAL
ncbi:hypothetical protein MASR2M78_12230 [Treponema sp.]